MVRDGLEKAPLWASGGPRSRHTCSCPLAPALFPPSRGPGVLAASPWPCVRAFPPAPRADAWPRCPHGPCSVAVSAEAGAECVGAAAGPARCSPLRVGPASLWRVLQPRHLCAQCMAVVPTRVLVPPPHPADTRDAGDCSHWGQPASDVPFPEHRLPRTSPPLPASGFGVRRLSRLL